MQSADKKSMSLFETYRNINEILDGIRTAEESGHGGMLDVYEKDLRDLLINAEGGIERCVGFVKFVELEEKSIDEEIARLKALKDRQHKGAERIKSLAMAVMETLGVKQLCGTFQRRFVLKESSAVRILALDQVPDEYKRVTTVVEANKALILRDLREGKEIASCELEHRKRVEAK